MTKSQFRPKMQTLIPRVQDFEFGGIKIEIKTEKSEWKGC